MIGFSLMLAHTLRSLGQTPVFSFTVPGAPYTNPVERMHSQVLSIIRSSQFLRLCVLDKDRVQDSLDEISSIINQRPIGSYLDPDSPHADDVAVLTPAALAWGAPFVCSGRLQELRKYFYEKCFAKLRRTHLVHRHQRRANVMVGQTALLYRPTAASKLTSPFRVCKIVDVKGAYLEVVCEGRTLQVGSAQLAPLSLFASRPSTLGSDSVPAGTSELPSRVGARVIATYSSTEFRGTVVRELGRECSEVEVCWDSVDGCVWNNEIVAWGACRVL